MTNWTKWLVAAGLIVSVPVSIVDHRWGLARFMPSSLLFVAVAVTLLTIYLGLSARLALGSAYTPRATAQESTRLVRHGLYRWIRDPMYLAALL